MVQDTAIMTLELFVVGEESDEDDITEYYEYVSEGFLYEHPELTLQIHVISPDNYIQSLQQKMKDSRNAVIFECTDMDISEIGNVKDLSSIWADDSDTYYFLKQYKQYGLNKTQSIPI